MLYQLSYTRNFTCKLSLQLCGVPCTLFLLPDAPLYKRYIYKPCLCTHFPCRAEQVQPSSPDWFSFDGIFYKELDIS